MKQMTKVKGALRDMKGKKSVGVVEHDQEKRILKIAKPTGVIGALLPVTNGEATSFEKAIFAIIMAPHPKAQKTNDQAMATKMVMVGAAADAVCEELAVRYPQSQRMMLGTRNWQPAHVS
jgi:hypothetical protein